MLPSLKESLTLNLLSEGGAPALHFTISTAMMGQRLDNWLLADDPQHGSFSMGLANIELKRGTAPASAATNASSSSVAAGVSPAREQPAPLPPQNPEADLEEAVFAFAKAPEEQIGRVIKGGSIGAKVRLESPGAGNKGRVIISLGGNESGFDVAPSLEKETAIPNTPFTVRIDNYWPDFRIQDGKPGSLSDQPNNPAVLVTIRGKGAPAAAEAAAPNPHGIDSGKSLTTNGGPPTMPAQGEAAPNRLAFFIADDGSITYQLVSRKTGSSTGRIEIGKPLTTGWADWQLIVDKTMPHAAQWMDFNPSKSDDGAAPMMAKDLPDGVRVRVVQDGQTFEQWVPAGWQISVPTSPNETVFAYGWKVLSLPIGLELLNFEVKRNEGTDSPAGFKSTLQVSTAEGDAATGSCWMNHPFSYPGEWWRTWTGLTFKISQASWNPENLNQSSVQILRDPGWSLKWIGSLLIVSGVFMMFYLRPYRRQTVGEPITLDPVKAEKAKHPPVSTTETMAQ